jgi:GNAT superfamily N-acetyltransferase
MTEQMRQALQERGHARAAARRRQSPREKEGLSDPSGFTPSQNTLHSCTSAARYAGPMSAPISIRLDDDVRDQLEAEARSRGIGLATLLREVATAAARDAKRARIRRASAAVAAHIAASAEGQAFYDEWGMPRADAR